MCNYLQVHRLATSLLLACVLAGTNSACQLDPVEPAGINNAQDKPRSKQLKLDAVITPHESKSGWLSLTVTNRAGSAVSFLDIPEGAHNSFWSIEVKTPSGQKFGQECLYSPYAPRKPVELKPQESYQRDFQTEAYSLAASSPLADEPCVVVIHYRTDAASFSSQPAKLRLSQVFPGYTVK